MRKLEVAFAVVVLTVLLAGGVAAQSLPEKGSSTGPLSAWIPPLPCQGLFTDVPCGSQFDTWIEQFYRDGITSGCSAGHYCPDTAVTRRQMAVFVERSMRGASGWPPHTVLVYHHPAAEDDSSEHSGTELLSMVAAIPSTGAEAPSSTNPWLIKVGPGFFDLGSGSLTLPAYTALEGAGEDVTTIAGVGYTTAETGTINVGDHSQVRLMNVVNWGLGGTTTSIGVSVLASATNVRLYRLTIEARQPIVVSDNHTFGVHASTGSQVQLSDVTITAHGGYYNNGVAFGASSQTQILDHVTITATGSSSSGSNYGVYSNSAPLLITDSTIDASTGWPVGVGVTGNVEWTMQSSRISATSGTGAAGIVNWAGVTHLQDVIVKADALGIDQSSCPVGTCYAEINHCTIFAGGYAIFNETNYSTLVAGSRLEGGTANFGVLYCMGNYTTTAFYATTCP